ncbi:MAG: helix-turn-helix domain-containing protein [Lutibacter sp.]|uniref:helix-turn-helix domain-containing protein n=1 Tax=Lutibacter sp. TaxID=1925666 RepID=UPI001A08C04F|nr:helix-turn-helix transcriptional regulator [Lutibacter sp.]NOR27557.1 helix-turn-helix domain-containing protein [Lutibacter sp.]
MSPEEFENIRKDLGWTKRKLAYKLGITEGKIYNYLNGTTKAIPRPIQILMRIYHENF